MVGVDYVKIFHFNDSKTDLGAHVDRHEHIGEGKIGKDAFKFILNDRRFTKVPMILETPKGKDQKEDKTNLDLLRSYIK